MSLADIEGEFPGVVGGSERGKGQVACVTGGIERENPTHECSLAVWKWFKDARRSLYALLGKPAVAPETRKGPKLAKDGQLERDRGSPLSLA